MASELEVGGLSVGSSSAAPVTVKATSGSEGIRIERHDATSQYLSINESNGGEHKIEAYGAKDFSLTNHSDSHSIKLKTNNTDRLTLDSTGEVKVIGSGSTGATLRLENTTTTTAADDIAGTVNFYTNDASDPSGGRVCGYVRSVADDQYNRYGLRFGTANFNETVQERMSISATGLATFSNGINLGDTTLSNYKEGTFTASLTAATTPPTSVPSTTGNYTRVGNMVKIQIRFDNDDMSGAVGAMKITGLPFTAASNNESNFDPVSAIFYGLPYSNSVGYVAGGTSEIVFYNQVNNAAWTAYNVDYSSTSGAGKFLFINATYTV